MLGLNCPARLVYAQGIGDSKCNSTTPVSIPWFVTVLVFRLNQNLDQFKICCLVLIEQNRKYVYVLRHHFSLAVCLVCVLEQLSFLIVPEQQQYLKYSLTRAPYPHKGSGPTPRQSQRGELKRAECHVRYVLHGFSHTNIKTYSTNIQ